MHSLSLYPLPIFSAKQAMELEGVGDYTGSIIKNLLKKQYNE